jgi:type II secretory pathway pseudopilin PulG
MTDRKNISLAVPMIRKLDESGYAYVLLLVMVLVLGILAAAGATLTSQEVRRDQEAELLFRGMAYRQALQSYYQASPLRAYPKRLEDLLQDPRVQHRQHLRKLYPDPFGEGWSLVLSADGGITGVASRSKQEPLKQAGFPQGMESFEGAKSYADWVFLARDPEK